MSVAEYPHFLFCFLGYDTIHVQLLWQHDDNGACVRACAADVYVLEVTECYRTTATVHGGEASA